MTVLAGANVLVSGGAGFVGSNLVRRLLDAGVAQVRVVDNLLSSEPENLPDDPRVRLTVASLADNAVLDGLSDDLDFVFHLATFHGNQNSIHDPMADHDNNLLPTLKLFDRLKDFRRVRRVVYSGAGCAVAPKTYERPDATPEEAPLSIDMDSPYSISKLAGEFYAAYYHGRHGLPVVRARFQNVYGPGEVLGAGRWRGTAATVWRNVTPTFIYKALKGEALPLEGGGAATRDFIFVDDVVRGMARCAEAGAPGDVYNLASGTETSILELAQTINQLTGNPTPPSVRPGREWDRSGRRFGSPAKARRELGFAAQVGLRDGLSRTIEWTRHQLPRIEGCIRRHDSEMHRVAAL